mgnify:CR=1 FL=1
MAWQTEEGFLMREFEFKNFPDAISFVEKIAGIAEEMQHHPDICIHSYNKVKVRMKTHSENKITEKDHALADKIDNTI